MALPKIKNPEYSTVLPLSNKRVSFRPYTVGDEKILLSAAASRDKDPKFYIKNTLDVIRRCMGESGSVLDSLSAVDVEFLLLQIRSKSVGEIVEMKFQDKNTKKSVDVSINLEKFYVKPYDSEIYTIKLTDTVGLKMRDLPFSEKITYGTRFTEKNRTDIVYETIVDCVESVFDDDTVYVVGKNCTKEEVREMIEGIAGVSQQLYEFVNGMPQLAVDVQMPDGTTQTLTGSDIDFLASSQAT